MPMKGAFPGRWWGSFSLWTMDGVSVERIGPGGLRQVSTAGGTRPGWRPDGKELGDAEMALLNHVSSHK